MTELVSMREYARRRGVSHVAVAKAAKVGRITLVDGKVDPVTADRDWKRNTDPSQQREQGGNGSRAGQNGGDAGPAPPSMPPGSGVNYLQSRAVRETFMARLAGLEYDVKRGALIKADEVRVTWFNKTRRARDMILGVPDRLAPVLAGQDNPFEVHRLLAEELRRVCDELAKPDAA
jgi:hypothetical protein